MSEDEKILKEAKKLSWEDRLAHKNWKVRNDANIDLAALCETILDPKDPRLKEFGPLFKKAVSDSNAPAQEKALDAVIAYLKAADVDAARYAKEICDAIVGKCLTGRPKTIEKAQAVFLLWVELEAADIFLDAMEKAVKNKVAKAVVPAIDAMYQAISLFGTKVVPPKKILKMLPDLFDHQDQNVRACAKGLTIEMCRWIGKDIVKSILFEKMRDTMKKELEAEVDAVTGVSKPSRKIRSEQEKELEPEPVVECPQAGHMDDSSTGGSPNVDEYELVDPVDILTQLGKSTFWEGVKASKWSERRDAVAELTKLASVKRLGAGDYAEVCRTLKKLIMDVNIAVAVEAVQAAGNLARGLRKDFASGARLLLPLLLDKLKEKKQVMVDALSQTLQALHKGGCIQLLDIVEEVKVATKNKVPSVRSLCLTWLTFCIETSSKALVLKLHKDYVPILMECLTDGTPEVRDAAFSALAAVAKSVGMRPLERALEKLDEVRRKKLIEMIGSNGGGALSTSVPGRVGSAFPGASDEAVDAVPKKSAASLLSGKKLVSGTASSTKKSAPVRPSTAKKSDGVGKHMPAAEPLEDLEPGCMSLEEIEARVGSLLEMDVLFKLKSSNWKERLEAITGLKATVEGLDDVQQHAELLIRLISLLPGWSEKNVQVQQKAIEIITHIAQNSLFSKRCVVLCVAGVAERVCDVKTRLQATKCLTVFCESVGPQFVFDRLFKIIKDHKNPKVLSECVLWLVSAVDDFGVAQIKLKDLIDFCKDVGLQSSAAASRNATVKLIGIVHKFVGPDIKVFLSDVKPALQSALDTEYEKNPYEGPVSAPRRAVRAVDPDVLSAGGGSDSLPREDISGKLTASLLKNLSGPEWKVRQESIEAINRIIEESHRRIQVTGTGELFGALKARLSDSNKNLIIMSLSTIGSLASAMGPAIEKSSKGILSDVLKCLSDNKKLVREAVVKTLDMWIMIVSLDKMLPCLMPTITDSKVCADGRRDLYEWLTRQIAKPANQLDLIQLVKAISQGLQDKSADVRRAAEACLIQMLTTSGADMVTKISRELQGTALAAVQPILERYKSPGATEEASQTMKGGKGLVIKSGKQVSIATGDRPPSRGGPAGPLRGSSKTPALKVTKQASAGAAQDAAVLGGQLLFHLKDSNKEERERLIPRKTKFEELRPDQIQDLENDMTKHFREDLHQKLLSPDFKKQVDGLELLQKAIPLHIKEITEVIDILLRWTVLRFCESNTTCLLKVLELLPELVEALKNEGYTLTEYESSVLLPCLVEKAGHNIEKVRERMRELMKALCCIYPASKVFMFVTEGLRSKNNRTRIECVDHIGDMIERYGIEISGTTKVLQTIAALTTERDSEIRKAALQTLAVTYKILGEDIWKYVGKVSDAQKSILDDKFKWKAREMIKRKEGKPGEVRAAMRRSVRENGLETAEPSGEGCRPLTAPPVLPSARACSGLVNSSADVTLIQHSSVHLSAPPGGPGDWNEALDIIEFGTTAEQFVEGMKLVCHELGQAVGDSESKALDDLGKDADRLVANLTLKVTVTFKLGLAGESSRSCKYVLNTLMQTFQVKKLAHEVKEPTLHNLIKELLLWLLDERVPLMDDGSQLLKALNVLMLKILENANRTSAFMVLIYLLRPFDPTIASCSSAEEAMLLRGQKFSDLVVKCLIKLTKVLGSTIYEVDLDRLLQSIHEYLQELGLEEIRRRAGADDKPLRMVKTVLHELVKLRGTAIKGHLSMVPIDLEPQPIILAYIDLNLQTLAAARMLTPSAGTGQAHWTDPTSNGPPTPANQSAEAQLKQELAAVFKKIGDKQTSAIGLYELYRITQLYPQVDIFAQLQNASEAFRAYIRDGLEQMGKNATGRTPVSIAFVSPPPVSPPTHGFPNTAPASPSNSRLHPFGQEFISNNNVVGNYREELGVKKGANVRGFSGRHEDVASEADGIADGQAGGPAHGHAGTLDAIRERMKNIQAAAAGTTTGGFVSGHSNGTSDARSFLEQAMEGPGVEGGRTGSAPAMDEKALSGLQERMARLKSSSVETFNPGWV